MVVVVAVVVVVVVEVVVHVKQFLYRSGQNLTASDGRDSHYSRQLAHEGSKVVSPTHWPPSPSMIPVVLISVRGQVDPRVIVRPEG